MKSYGDTGASSVQRGAGPLRILVVRLSSMGDVLHALPVAVRLKQALPRLELTWAVHERWSPLLRDNPSIDRVIELPLGRWRAAPRSSAAPTGYSDFHGMRFVSRLRRRSIRIGCHRRVGM